MAEEGWITINGAHIYVKDGESISEAFERQTGKALETKSNPEQRADAKKFSINDALAKATNERAAKSNAALDRAWRNGDKEEHAVQFAKNKEIYQEGAESGEMTEKGRQARIASDEKKAAKNDKTEAELSGTYHISDDGTVDMDKYTRKSDGFFDSEGVIADISDRFDVSEGTLRDIRDSAVEKGYTEKEATQLASSMAADGRADKYVNGSDIPELSGAAKYDQKEMDYLNEEFSKNGTAETGIKSVAENFARKLNAEHEKKNDGIRVTMEKRGNKIVLNEVKWGTGNSKSSVNDNIRAAAKKK